jgi:hypothetical protein
MDVDGIQGMEGEMMMEYRVWRERNYFKSVYKLKACSTLIKSTSVILLFLKSPSFSVKMSFLNTKIISL